MNTRDLGEWVHGHCLITNRGSVVWIQGDWEILTPSVHHCSLVPSLFENLDFFIWVISGKIVFCQVKISKTNMFAEAWVDFVITWFSSFWLPVFVW